MTKDVESLAVVSFAAGGIRFAVEARQIHGMLTAGHADASPIAAEALIGLPAQTTAPRKWLMVGNKCVEVSGPVELETLPATSIFPLPPLVAARTALSGLKGLAVMPAGVILLVDLRAIVSSAE